MGTLIGMLASADFRTDVFSPDFLLVSFHSGSLRKFRARPAHFHRFSRLVAGPVGFRCSQVRWHSLFLPVSRVAHFKNNLDFVHRSLSVCLSFSALIRSSASHSYHSGSSGSSLHSLEKPPLRRLTDPETFAEFPFSCIHILAYFSLDSRRHERPLVLSLLVFDGPRICR